ncbi:hypothetical protein FGG08_001095 [Glutinoglossum americanum]|uniref:Uncharacterized protein n=1 Tax=Glutinoglossum americanum TaxID=1670608 RepID=A0A9P8IC26_9PEZI|nr:hypothetical protein FGG08_001095 [Glutinoglossum americanum]
MQGQLSLMRAHRNPDYWQIPHQQGNGHGVQPTACSPSPMWRHASQRIAHAPKPTSFLVPVLALILTSTITAALILLVFTDPTLVRNTEFSNLIANVWTASISIIATVIAAFIRGELKALWLKEVDRQLESNYTGDTKGYLNSTWRTVLQIGTIMERVRNIRIELTYLVAALLFTCIASGFSINKEFKKVDYSPEIPDGSDYLCANTTSTPPNARDDEVGWALDNGDYFVVHSHLMGCPPSEALALTSNINPIRPAAFAYSDMGIGVSRAAIGAPASIYGWVNGRDEAIIKLIEDYSVNLQGTHQCVPVMKQNPISCRRGGMVELSRNNMTVISDDESCTAGDAFLESGADPLEDRVMVKGMCAGEKLGEASIVMAATSGFAPLLSRAVGELEDPPQGPGDWFAVTCSVNVSRDTFEHRSVGLYFQTNVGAYGSFGKALKGEGRCSGPDPSNALIAMAAAANQKVLLQNFGLDGWFQALADLALNSSMDGDYAPRKGPWAFNESSNNALEDVLGLTSALVSSRIYNERSQMRPTEGYAEILAWRVGSGSKFALIFAVPPFFVMLFFWKRLVVLRGLRTRTETSSLEDLIAYGREGGHGQWVSHR